MKLFCDGKVLLTKKEYIKKKRSNLTIRGRSDNDTPGSDQPR
ncbi:MAG: hypothetical protein ACI8RD_010608 [Bacillariaceae sp.]|jgi:hypothetical protein